MAAAAAKNPKIQELSDAFEGIMGVFKKMQDMEPKLADKLDPIMKQTLAAAVSIGIDPKNWNTNKEAESTGTVEGNKSPQEAGETPPAPSAESNEAKVPA
jgi:hypothetical protein